MIKLERAKTKLKLYEEYLEEVEDTKNFVRCDKNCGVVSSLLRNEVKK